MKWLQQSDAPNLSFRQVNLWIIYFYAVSKYVDSNQVASMQCELRACLGVCVVSRMGHFAAESHLQETCGKSIALMLIDHF